MGGDVVEEADQPIAGGSSPRSASTTCRLCTRSWAMARTISRRLEKWLKKVRLATSARRADLLDRRGLDALGPEQLEPRLRGCGPCSPHAGGRAGSPPRRPLSRTLQRTARVQITAQSDREALADELLGPRPERRGRRRGRGRRRRRRRTVGRSSVTLGDRGSPRSTWPPTSSAVGRRSRPRRWWPRPAGPTSTRPSAVAAGGDERVDASRR